MRFEHSPFPQSDLLDARPLSVGWSVLRKDGPFDLTGLEPPYELHVSPDGAFSAVVERFGQRGKVFHERRITLSLDRGDYCSELSVFPAAFIVREGRMLLVHGTDWNRLDISDPATGELLTPRRPTSLSGDKPEPDHYLDYFHAGLCVSPNGGWIAENGWIWHPLGQLRAWSLDAWLGGNVWESEDGPSIQMLAERVYFWDGPHCWLDNERLAFWGEGDHDDDMKAALRVYDVVQRREVASFPGPVVAPHMPWPCGSARQGWIAFDKWLFAISPERGTGVWDIASGDLLHFEAGFAPRRYHAGRREFLSWDERGAFVSHLLS